MIQSKTIFLHDHAADITQTRKFSNMEEFDDFLSKLLSSFENYSLTVDKKSEDLFHIYFKDVRAYTLRVETGYFGQP